MPPRITRNHEYAKILSRTVRENQGFTTLANTTDIIDSADVTQILSGITSSSLVVYDTLDSLPTSSLTKGGQGYVKATQRLYVSDSFGWYSMALVNLTPTQTLDPSGNITLSTDGTSTIVTITAADSDQPEAHLTYSVESDGNMLATGTTVTQDSSVFTITPLTADSGGVTGNFTLTFKTTDSVNIATTTKDFSLTLQSTGTLTSSAASVNEGSSVTFTLPTTGYSDGTTFAYTITGIQAGDISQGLTGNMTVASNNATVTISTVADLTTEGAQTMTFSADGQSVNVTINDTSIAPPEEGRWSARYSGYSGSGTSLPNLGAASSADGTLKSGVSYNSSNQWFEFDGGSNAFVQYPNENGQYPYGDFTIYAIVNINSYGNSNEWDNILENRLLHLNGANSSVTSRRGGITSSIENGYPEFYYCDTNQAYNVLRSTTRMNLNQWYFLAFTRQKSTGAMKIYVNNTSTPTNTTTKSTLDVKHANFGYEISTGITFGKRVIATFPNTYGFKGKAIEWGIYDKVLSTSEMNTIKNKFSEV